MFLIGSVIREVFGILERTDANTQAEHYSAVLETSSGNAILTQRDITRIDLFPDGIRDMPAQVLDGDPNVTGCVITAIVVSRHPSGSINGLDDKQVFLVLDSQRLMGVVPTAQGTLLHVEAVRSSPLRRDDSLEDLDGRPVSVESLILH